ncbi:hypothetical protein HDU76_011028, partial [Blyttiomyces sp. JEL0837]
MTCAILSNISGNKLSQAIRSSMAATDLVRGIMRMPALKDYFNHGPQSPGYSIYRVSTIIALLAEAMIVACIVLFQWKDVPTFLKDGPCISPNYDGATLPANIDITQFILGSVEPSTVLVYALPLKDGLLGGFAGWPLISPGSSYQITGAGPTYLVSSLCGDGVPRPDIIMQGHGVLVNGSILASDSVSFLTYVTFMYPPNLIVDDVSKTVNNVTFYQRCMVEFYVGSGEVKVGFTIDQYLEIAAGNILEIATSDGVHASYLDSVNHYVNDFKNSFLIGGVDTYGIRPLLQDAVGRVIKNKTYSPSQGSNTTNFLNWAVGSDGLYHTSLVERGIGTVFAGLAHYVVMQFNSNAAISCSYF